MTLWNGIIRINCIEDYGNNPYPGIVQYIYSNNPMNNVRSTFL